MSIDQTSPGSGDNTYVSFLPVAERLGLIPDELADLDTLAQRLQEAAVTAQAVVVTPPLICASTRPTGSEANK